VIMLLPRNHPWESLIKSLDMFSDDFMNDRNTARRTAERWSLMNICWIQIYAYTSLKETGQSNPSPPGIKAV